MKEKQLVIKNHPIFRAWVQALLEKGCPYPLAETVAVVVSHTDTDKPNLGRSDGEKEIISIGLEYLVGTSDR